MMHELFTVLFTIADLERIAPVSGTIRQTLRSLDAQISGIRTAARVVVRV